jgi:YidC/Oxa1 family membrane protein insertase
MTMEKRVILAVVLWAAVFIVYQVLYPPEAPQQKPPAQTAQTEPARTPEPAPPVPAAPVVAPKAAPPVNAPAAPRPPQRLTPVNAPLYRAVVSSEGGKLQELTLEYRGERPIVLLGDLGPAGLLVSPDASAAAAPVPMTMSAEKVAVEPGHPETLALAGETGGLRVRQSLRFDPDTYAIGVSIRVENPTSAPRKVTVELPWSSRISWAGLTEKFPGQHPIEVVWSVHGSIDRAPHSMSPTLEGLVDHQPKLGREGDWIALGSVWYLAALLPKTGGFQLVTSVDKPEEAKDGRKASPGRVAIGVRATPEIAPGKAWEGEVTMFAGPKEYRLLEALKLEETLNFGGFPIPWYWGGLPMRWIGVPILLLMNWTYRHVGNYGVAIILLTVISKILFYPLTVKGMRSMKAMQALAPQVNALRSRYQKDPQALQRETMALYRKNKVNPMGGCLPMVAQVPIFYALYLALSVSVELQNAKFLCFGKLFGVDLWICDLAAHDPTYVLPILMGITMFVQQKLTPTMGDPRQAKMMLFMPVVFTFMFLNLPSGLVLYWTVSNVLQIAQQKLMDRPARSRATREAKDASRA